MAFCHVGFPIRKSSDQCSIDSSPKLTAVLCFLHRLLIPWHPPNALFNYLQILRLSFNCLFDELKFFRSIYYSIRHKNFKDH